MKKIDVAFLLTGSIMTIIFLVIVNLLTSKEHVWFIYPTAFMLIFPFGLYCFKMKKQTFFSVISSAIIFFLLVIENIRSTPEHPWALYTIIPLVYWPMLMILRRKVKPLRIAIIGSGIFILYYCLLNLLVSPYTPWVIFPVFAILWWPLSVYHARRKSYFSFSLQGATLLCAFFIMVNVFYSPSTIWAIYPIFTILWWPLSMYYFVYKRNIKS
ncbi:MULTISPECIES: hypothetical protein [Virgibacillus]|uniref:Uncharacterized protein n=1 Tax=Virgibacillus massiliensis TaxID=1462526 RepID=A0A024QFZ4_9BACI|nr:MULTISPECIES: hypothetical protein [Virgibacillus]EQB38996.1 hypothetical protein M948_01210 [Virgibacillus sp. CM-4]MYL43358.1 hypothetical protein [Virgibacillus massiliensis]CDQ41120.1 hypothetical protein BN990_03475 [Virgibacillus massiliensis]